MSYAAKLVMHLNQGPKGSTMVRELTDYPGIMVSDFYDKKNRKTIRKIIFSDKEYKTIDEAVAAHKEAGREKQCEG